MYVLKISYRIKKIKNRLDKKYIDRLYTRSYLPVTNNTNTKSVYIVIANGKIFAGFSPAINVHLFVFQYNKVNVFQDFLILVFIKIMKKNIISLY